MKMIGEERKVSSTRIGESFDDGEHIVDLPVDEHVVHLDCDVLAASQAVSQRTEAASETAARVCFRTAHFPAEERDFQNRVILEGNVQTLVQQWVLADPLNSMRK